MKLWSLLLLCALVSSCSSTSSTNYRSYAAALTSPPPLVVDDKNIRHVATKKLKELTADESSFTPHSELLKQLERKECTLSLKPIGFRTMTPAEIYQERLKSVVMVGVLHHCKSEKCKKTHFSPASGVVIHRDGVVLTNYHVVASKTSNLLGMAAQTVDGDIYLVDEVLAADESSDIAILKLKGASNLPAAPLFKDEPVGNPVTLITHPVGSFYTLTQGYVSRYYKDKQKRVSMMITADYAKGSSGGPIFNDRGDVVGLVRSTRSITYTNVPLAKDPDSEALTTKKPGTEKVLFQGKQLFLGMNHQMTFKHTSPSQNILKLIKQK